MAVTLTVRSGGAVPYAKRVAPRFWPKSDARDEMFEASLAYEPGPTDALVDGCSVTPRRNREVREPKPDAVELVAEAHESVDSLPKAGPPRAPRAAWGCWLPSAAFDASTLISALREARCSARLSAAPGSTCSVESEGEAARADAGRRGMLAGARQRTEPATLATFWWFR